MAVLRSLQLASFRNIDSLSLLLHPRFNFFYGDNGAGKTSLLESLYYLSRGRSFRAPHYQKLIQNGQDRFFIYVEAERNGHVTPIGFEREHNGAKRVRIDGENGGAMSEVVSHLPVIFLSSLSYQFFVEGPATRRQYMDWLTFHVKPSFYATWKAYQNLLKQRNSAIKQKRPWSEITVWDKEFASLSQQIDALRKAVVSNLRPYLQQYMSKLLPNISLSLQYEPGWNTEEGLEEGLFQQRFKDMQIGYTQLGPHRADFKLLSGGVFAGDRLSQGQQKIAIFALQLAMGAMLTDEKETTPIYLLDDLASELDSGSRRRLIHELSALKAQVLVTGIVFEELQEVIQAVEGSVFHVKHGKVREAAPFATEKVE